MVAHRLGRSQMLAAAYLGFFALLDATEARVIIVHPSRPEVCFDDFDNEIPCPHRPVSNLKIILAASITAGVLLLLIGIWLYRVLRARRVQKYQALPTPAPNAFGPQGGGVMIPAAPGEMGYAGPQPQLPYYPVLPRDVKTYAPSPSPMPRAVYATAPIHPPPPSAATHYGYSVGPI